MAPVAEQSNTHIRDLLAHRAQQSGAGNWQAWQNHRFCPRTQLSEPYLGWERQRIAENFIEYCTGVGDYVAPANMWVFHVSEMPNRAGVISVLAAGDDDHIYGFIYHPGRMITDYCRAEQLRLTLCSLNQCRPSWRGSANDTVHDIPLQEAQDALEELRRQMDEISGQGPVS